MKSSKSQNDSVVTLSPFTQLKSSLNTELASNVFSSPEQ